MQRKTFLAGGSIDVGIGSPSQVAGAKEKGLPFTFFAPGGLYAADAPSSLLMVGKDSSIRTARDLAGKTIAVDNLTSFTQFGAIVWLRKNGVDPATIKFVELPFSSMAGAIEAGRVDAAEIAEPARSAGRATLRLLADTNVTIGPSWFAMSRCRFGTKLEPALMDPIIDIAAKNGMIPAPIAGRAMVYPGFAA
jgi:NitT/TauT family transport system substrate-binding protein